MATVVNSAEGSWSVSGTTATYKVGGKTVATLKGLKSGLSAEDFNGAISAGEGTGAGTITISSDKVDKKKVTLKLANGGSYELALGGGIASAEASNFALNFGTTVSKGTATVTADLKEGYTLTDAKTISYTATASGATMATISGLKKSDTTAEKVTLSGQEVKVFKEAFTASNLTLANSAAANALCLDYSFVFSGNDDQDSDRDGVIGFETSKNYWTVALNNKTISKATSATATYKFYTDAGYTLTNAKKITYTKPVETTIATIAGLNKDTRTSTSTTSGNTITEDLTDARANSNALGILDGEEFTEGGVAVVDSVTDSEGNVTAGTFTLSEDILNTVNTTLTLGKNQSYALKLEEDVTPVKITVDVENSTFKNSTATIKGTPSEGWTLTNEKTVFYSKPIDVILAKITGLKANVTADDINGKVVTLGSEQLGTAAVKITSNYGLTLGFDENDDDLIPTELPEEQTVWRVTTKKNIATAVYKRVIPAYYTYDSSTNTITYHKETDVADGTIATITGLSGSLTVQEDPDGANSKLGINIKDADSETETFTEAVSVDGTEKTFTLSENALGSSNVTIKSDDYKLVLDGDVNAPALDEEATTSWTFSKGTATLKATKTTAGYKLSNDGSTVVYTAAGKNTTLATVTGLSTDLTAKMLNEGTDTPIDTDNTNRTITLKKDALSITNVNLTSNFGYGLELGEGVQEDKANTLTWKLTSDTTAKLRTGTSAYYTLGENKDTVSYNAATFNNDSVATLSGFQSGLTLTDGLFDENTIKVNSGARTITLSKAALGARNVTLETSGGYKLLLKDASDLAAKSNETTWAIYGTVALLQDYTTKGYTLSSDGKTITYSQPQSYDTYAVVEGIKSGLSLNSDGGIDGIDVDKSTGTVALSKSVLGTGNVKLTNRDNNNYKLALGSDLAKSETTYAWTGANANKGTATVTVSTTAGYEVVEDAKTSTLVYNKKSSVPTTISGIATEVDGANLSTSNVEDIITVDLLNKTLTLKEDALNEAGVSLKGGNFTFVLEDAENLKPKVGDNPTLSGSTAKGVVTLKGTISSGYTLADDAKSVAYTAAKEKETTLVTISGLKPNLTAEEVSAGVKIKGNTITLSPDVLTTSNVTIKNDGGYNYKFELADGVVTSEDTDQWKDQTEWVTSGNTATYKTYNKGYYSINANGQVVYTKPTAGTTHATLTGVASTVDLNADGYVSGDVITLKTDDLAKKNLALTNKTGYNFSLELAGDVATSADKIENEWTTAKNVASCKTYNQGYYKKTSGTAVTYVKESNVVTLATVSGISNDTDISKRLNNNVITLTADDLTTTTTTTTADGATTTSTVPLGKNVVLKDSSQTYKLALATDEDTAAITAKANDPVWTTKYANAKNPENSPVTATYTQTTLGKTYTQTSDTQITYSAKDATKTLATVSGLPNALSGKEDAEGSLERSGITVEDGVITLSDEVLGETSQVKLTSTDYKLAFNPTAKPETGDPYWKYSVSKGSGTAVYGYEQGAGYVLSSDGKTITSTPAQEFVTIATISGLNADLYEKDGDGNYVDGNDDEEDGIQKVDLFSGGDPPITADPDEDGNYTFTLSAAAFKGSNVTLKGSGKLVVAEGSEPQAFSSPKWYVNKTTATLKDGQSAGYTVDAKGTTIKYTGETTSTTLATVTGLKSGLKPDSDGKIAGLVNTSIEGIIPEIKVSESVLGTSTVKLTGDGYVFNVSNLKEPDPGEAKWSDTTLKSKGTATLTQTSEAGRTLSDDKTTITYTAGKTTTLATVSGLNKNLAGDLSDYISCANKVITLEKELLTTSNVTVSGTGYSLELGDDIPIAPSSTTGWLTSGTTATYKTYDEAYYTKNSKGAIVYNKPTTGTTHVTITGLLKGVDISDCADGTVVKLTADKLTTSNVAIKNASGYNYTLALAEDVPLASDSTTWENKTEWVTSGNTATFKEGYNRNSYTLNATGTGITVKKGTAGTTKATVVGVKETLSAQTGVDTVNGTVTLTASQLSDAVTISGSYAFNFSSDSYNGSITGSAAADTITVAGEGAYLNAGKGNDTIKNTGFYAKIFGGDGNDSITNSGGKVSISGGAGADTISSTGLEVTILGGAGNDSIDFGQRSDLEAGLGNVFVYANNEGNDSIANFNEFDTINVTNVAISASNISVSGGSAVIAVGKGNITLEDYSDDITIIDKTGTAKTYTLDDNSKKYVEASTGSSSDLLRDDNFTTATPQLSSIVNDTGISSSLGELDTSNATSLVQKADLVTYSSSKK